MALKLITAAASYPVTLAEAKAHLAVDFSDHDALIEIYRKAATEEAEQFTGRSFIDQTFDYYVDAFPTSGIKIPMPPLIAVTGVFYNEAGGAELEYAASSYVVDAASELARIVPAGTGVWPTVTEFANAVRVRFRAGYVDDDQSPPTGSVPFAIKAAILLMTGTLYAQRETVVVGQTVAMIPAAENLLRHYRVHTALA